MVFSRLKKLMLLFGNYSCRGKKEMDSSLIRGMGLLGDSGFSQPNPSDIYPLFHKFIDLLSLISIIVLNNYSQNRELHLK